MLIKLNTYQKMLIKLNALLFKSTIFRMPNLTIQTLQKLSLKSVLNKVNQKLNLSMHKNTTKTELASYLHSCCFSPTHSVFIRALKKRTLSLCQTLPFPYSPKYFI